jgi:glycosyltransferase involved in cell wall biosynthesis
VSIIIPTFNHAHFLIAALDSVIAQTKSDWDVIVVNNFSDDNTIELVESYGDSRIRLVNFANHGNIASARNYGLSLAQAPNVAFLDSDDFWYPEKLERCLEKMALGYDLVCHAEIWAGPGGSRRKVCYGGESRATYDRLLINGNCLSTSAVLVKRECLQRVGNLSTQSEFITAEDYELWLKLAKAEYKFGFINQVLGEYRIHKGNQSRQALRNMYAVLAVFEHHKKMSHPSISFLLSRRREAIICYGGARSLQASGEFMQAWPLFFRAMILCPWLPRVYIAALLNLFRLRFS